MTEIEFKLLTYEIGKLCLIYLCLIEPHSEAGVEERLL